MKYLQYIIIGIVLVITPLIMSGCGGAKRVEIEKEPLPSWYINPPQSNKEYLYAVGEGKDKKEALANALSDMVATLGVSISSEYNAKTVVKEGFESTKNATYKNEVNAKVQEIRISNYELLNFKKLGFKRYGVLVRSDKNKLFQNLYSDIKHRFEAINSKDLSKYNALEKLAFYRDSLHSLSHLQNTLMVMSSLNSSFDSSDFLAQYAQLKKRYETQLAKISFSIKPTRKAKALASVISKGLTKKHFTIAKRMDENHFTVYIEMKVEYADAYGIALAQSTVDFVTKDYKNKIVSANTLNITGQSSQGYKIAKQNVAKKLNQLVEEQGIGKILNLDI